MAKKYNQPPARPVPPKPQPPRQKPRGVENTENQAVAASIWEPAGWLRPAMIALAITAVLYLPSIFHEYVNWDDDPNISENENLQRIDAQSLRNIFDLDKGNVIGNYNPLPIFTFALEKMALGKFSPHFTHLLNWLLHLGTVFFVIRFLLHLGISRWGAFVGGLLFGIHPMRVESVAWATERKDVLFGIFFFAALMYYVRWVKSRMAGEPPKWGLYATIVVLALLSHLSKVQAVTLVFSMYLVDYWFSRVESVAWVVKNACTEKLPFFIMAAAIGFANIYTLNQTGSTDDNVTNFSAADRFFIGTYQFCTYLYKLLVPYPMSPLYPYDRQLPTAAYFAPLGFLGLLGAGLWMFWKGRYRALVFGLFFFFFNVMFLLQWKPAGQGYLADRFTYVPYFGFFFLAAWLYDRVGREKPERLSTLNAALGAMFFIFAIVSYRQIKIWKNGETLWTHVIGFEKKSISLAWGNRAHYFRGIGEAERALKDYDEAIKISPNRSDHYNSRGKCLFDMAMSDAKYKGKVRELTDLAIKDYTTGLGLKDVTPKAKAEMSANRGAALASLNRYEEALRDLTEAIALDPKNKNAYSNRSLVWYTTGQYQRAIEDYSKILEMEPNNPNYWYERGLCKNSLSDFAGAVPDLTRALALNPQMYLAYFERARAGSMLGNKDVAREDIRKAQQLGMKLTPETLRAVGL